MISSKPSTSAVEQGVSLPSGYQEAKDMNLVNLRPWHFVSDKEFDLLFAGIKNRYPDRTVIPFARREDNDDVAAFVSRDPEQETGGIPHHSRFCFAGYELSAE